MIEHFFFCPYCLAQISMLLDTSVAQQEYVEDCEVCCNPILLQFTLIDHQEVGSFDASSIE